ncbi:MAG: alpha/beta hydrolase [Flavobacteriaceae bacterium]|nr:alpha/beta hydrolase [Flavobacteriaceae bacterium]
MKKRLLILSDLWGAKKSDWITNYFNLLEVDFDITYYDCCELGAVDKTVMTEEALHVQFINHGITTAVEKLLKLELEEVNVLAFSIGGAIAWKAALNGLIVKNLYAISATRLRYEVEQPVCDIKLCYGADDFFIPSIEWFDKMTLQYNIIDGVGHDLYFKKCFSISICDEITRKCL